jgi:Fe-S cluster biogenesis protein NfuA
MVVQRRFGRRDEPNTEAPMEEQVADTQEAEGPLDDAGRAKRLADLQALIDLMRPAVQSDGGDLVLVHADVDLGVVEVELAGACSSCAVSSATLQGGVERILRDRLPWVTEVIGGLDESMDDFESAALGRGAYVPRI